MDKNAKLMKYLAVLITAVQIAMVVFWLFNCYIIVANAANFAPFGHGELRYFLLKYYSIEHIDVFRRILSSLIIPILTFMILRNIKMIFGDMASGIRFTVERINKVKLIAWLFIAKGVLTGLVYFIFDGFTMLSVISIFDYGLVIGLIILALVPIFRHGVEMQTDSDMTV